MNTSFNKITRGYILILLIMFCCAISAEENDDQYLLSAQSYEVLTAARELMEKTEYVAAESKLHNLLNTGINNYEKAVVYQTLGYIYISMNKYDSATTAFTNSVKDNALPPEVNHEINYTLAQLLAQSSKYKESLEYLNRWLDKEKDPKPEAHMFAASIYYQLADYKNMIPQIQSAIAKSTKPQKDWYEMLLAGFYQTDDLKKAAELLEKMVKLYPDSSNYWLQLAATFYQIKDYEKSLAVYKLAYTKNILNEEEIIRLARLYLNDQLPYQAGKLLEETMEQGKISKSADNTKLLANSWLLAKEYDRAVSALMDLTSIDNDPNTYFRIGQIYFEQEKWQATITTLERVVNNEKLDNQAEAYLLLGIAAYHVDENSRSAEALKKAIGYKNTRQQAEWWLNKLGDKLEEKSS